MDFFNLKRFVLLIVLVVFIAPGIGQDVKLKAKVNPTDTSFCRAEIEATIVIAMDFGDQRGIDLLTSTANSFSSCLAQNDTTLGNLYHKAGVLYYSNSAYNDAIFWFNKALKIREESTANSVEPLLNTLNGLTQTHLQLFHYDVAEQLIERQLYLTKGSDYSNSERRAELYLADAQLAFLIEDYSRCQEKLKLASSIFESINSTSFNYGVVLNMLGATNDLLNKPDIAVVFYNRAIELFDINQELQFKALSYHNLGMAYLALRQFKEASVFFNESFNIHNTFNDTLELARNYVEMAKVELAMAHYEKAELYAEKSLSLRREKLIESHIDVIESLLVLGNIKMEFAEKLPAKRDSLQNTAMQLFDEALIASLKSPRNEKSFEPLVNKAVLCARIGRQNLGIAKQAHVLFHQADSVIQLSRLQFRHQDSKIEFTRKIHYAYEVAIKNALLLFQYTKQEKYFEEALIFCERSKATAVRDKLHKQAVQSFAGLPDSILKYERQLNLQLGAATQELLTTNYKTDSLYIPKLKSLEEIKHKMEVLDENLEKDYPRYFEWLKEPARNAKLTDLQHSLQAGSILIEYFIGEKELYLFGVSENHFQYWRLKNNQEVSSIISSYIVNIENSMEVPILSISDNSFKTYQLLLEKPLLYFESKGEVKNIKIVPDGIIGKVPFDALMTSKYSNAETDPPYLIRKYSHSFLYSNRLLLDKAVSKNYFTDKPCAIFGVDYLENKKLFNDSVYGSLPFIKEEVINVHEQSGGKLFINENATVNQLENKLKDSEIMHIAVHGSFNEENPEASGLIFSKKEFSDKRDNILTLAAIYGLTTKAELIYLSACFGGKGKLSASEGVMSLSRAFTYAGAKSQVITLWEVSDRASAIIAKNFYSNLKKGKSKDEALRLAKLKYIEESSTAVGQNPFFWAGSVVVGNAEPLYVDVLVLQILLVIVLLATLIFWYWWKRKQLKS